MSVEERVLAVEPILCCGIEEAIHSFGLIFTKSEVKMAWLNQAAGSPKP